LLVLPLLARIFLEGPVGSPWPGARLGAYLWASLGLGIGTSSARRHERATPTIRPRPGPASSRPAESPAPPPSTPLVLPVAGKRSLGLELRASRSFRTAFLVAWLAGLPRAFSGCMMQQFARVARGLVGAVGAVALNSTRPQPSPPSTRHGPSWPRPGCSAPFFGYAVVAGFLGSLVRRTTARTDIHYYSSLRGSRSRS